ncbi:MAG: hypothetical protein ACUVUF_08550, partial [Candidatus Bathycorpusculaceae bacterium]
PPLPQTILANKGLTLSIASSWVSGNIYQVKLISLKGNRFIYTAIAPYGIAQGCYEILDKPDGSTHYRLNVSVSQSLYEYYLGKSHESNSTSDFAKFVTPYALKPIADSLWEIYTDDEDFANGVLMIVHQIPYKEIASLKYPVETIVEDKGDCDLFSVAVASIMKAGGLDVVLLYYESEAHMNVGVHLSHIPQYVRGQAYYVTHNGVRYYTAECTGGNWETGWRVGECPSELQYANVQIITLESCEQTAPEQVSTSYKIIAQEESLHMTKQHVWYNTTGGWAEAAVVIINTGTRDIVLDKISVRGQECPWANVYYWKTNNTTISNDLQVTSTPLTGDTFNITVQGVERVFQRATDDLTLEVGWTVVVYIMNPDSITSSDIGITVGMTVFTANATYYYKETSVEAAG